MQIDDGERRARLAHRHRLLPGRRSDDLTVVADDLVALHSSDPVTVYLSLFARLREPSVAAVEEALYERRRLIRHHAMRRTLWVATPEVTRAMHAAATGGLVAPERKRLLKLLAEGEVAEPEEWLVQARRQTVEALRAQGPLTARQLGETVPALRRQITLGAGTPWQQTVSAHTRVLLLLGFEGAILRVRPQGSWINGAYAYAAADGWLQGGLGGLEPRTAAAELTRRWLRGFGPATTDDLRWWMGWTVATTRRALADAGAVPVELGAGPGWLAADDAGPPEPEPWVAVLPSLDPTTMGWKGRDWYLPAAAADAFDRNGNAGPTLWVDGRVVGAWAQTPDGALATHYFERVAAGRRRAIDEELARLRTVIGPARFTARFPGRIRVGAPPPVGEGN